jgi:hypothetical protein
MYANAQNIDIAANTIQASTVGAHGYRRSGATLRKSFCMMRRGRLPAVQPSPDRQRAHIDTPDLGSLLGRIQAIRHACDLDLLLFFHRHPCALLTSEQLTARLGYDRARIAQSLDSLIGTGVLTRSRHPARAALLYVLNPAGFPGGALASFLEHAATYAGRQAVMRLLATTTDGATEAVLQSRASQIKVA